MNPLLLLLPQLLQLAVGKMASPSDVKDQGPVFQQIDPVVLSAIVAAAQQQPVEVTQEVKLPRSAAIVAAIVVVGFFALLASIASLLIFFNSEKLSAALAVLCVGFGVLSSKFGTVVDFLFGSSWGSRTKDARPKPSPAPVPVPVPTPTPAPEPTPTPAPEPTSDPTLPPVNVDGVGRSTSEDTVSKRMDIPYNSVPASIRYNNPGAQWPSKAAAKFGQIGFGWLNDGQGNKIARFPHPVNGAAANFDLLYRNYTGLKIGEAGKKWTGNNSFGVPGYDPNTVLTEDMLNDPTTAIAFMKAIAEREAGRKNTLTDEQWLYAYQMFRAGSADAWLNSSPSPLPKDGWKPAIGTLADKIVVAMERKGYSLDRNKGEVNIVYVEGLNDDGTVNDDAPDKWNDLRVVIGFDGDKPVILGKWQATTEPGAYYTQHPVNEAGAARIEFGQYSAWKVGMHRGDHEALVQTGGEVTVCRDLDRDMVRTNDKRDTGYFGINQHWGYDQSEDSIGKASAGCLVGRTEAGHRAFMAIVKSDPRYVRDPEFVFKTAILAERDVVIDERKTTDPD
jgi:hypothetical protein